MSRILDAMDKLSEARDLVRLLQLAVDGSNEDDSARSIGCEVTLEKLDAVMRSLRKIHEGEAA